MCILIGMFIVIAIVTGIVIVIVRVRVIVIVIAIAIAIVICIVTVICTRTTGLRLHRGDARPKLPCCRVATVLPRLGPCSNSYSYSIVTIVTLTSSGIVIVMP